AVAESRRTVRLKRVSGPVDHGQHAAESFGAGASQPDHRDVLNNMGHPAERPYHGHSSFSAPLRSKHHDSTHEVSQVFSDLSIESLSGLARTSSGPASSTRSR